MNGQSQHVMLQKFRCVPGALKSYNAFYFNYNVQLVTHELRLEDPFGARIFCRDPFVDSLTRPKCPYLGINCEQPQAFTVCVKQT